MIDLSHAGIQARQHPRTARFLGQGSQRPDRNHRKFSTERKSLRDTARDSDAGEGTRPGTESNAAKLPHRHSGST